MTPDEINKFLAVEVMGWPSRQPNSEQIRVFLNGSDITYSWNPYHSITHAMRVLEHLRSRIDTHGEIDRIAIETRGEKWSVTIDCEGWSDHDLPAAISLAAVEWVKAKGGATR